MNGTNRTLAFLASAALIVALALGAFAAFRPTSINVTVPSGSGGSGSNGPLTGLTVTGSSTIHVTPDTAIFDFGVSATAPSVKAAPAMAAVSANAALDALAQLGIASKDITTTNISLYLQSPTCPVTYPVPYPGTGTTGSGGGSSAGGAPDASPAASDGVTIAPILPTQPTPILPACLRSGYTFSESFEVTVRAIDNLGGAIDAVAAAGTTDISGIRFSLADSSAPESAARTAAVAVAHARATTLADAAGAKLGAVLSLSENSSNPFVYYDYKLAPAAAGGSSSTPVSPGTLDVTVSVTITYALGQ